MKNIFITIKEKLLKPINNIDARCHRCGKRKVIIYKNGGDEYMCEYCGSQWHLDKNGKVYEL